jgi:hypothetical protein
MVARSLAEERISKTFHLGRLEILLPSQEHPDVAEGVA